MATEVITTDDLREFKIELLEDLKRLLKEHSGILSQIVCLRPNLKKGFPQNNFIINNDKNYGENSTGNRV